MFMAIRKLFQKVLTTRSASERDSGAAGLLAVVSGGSGEQARTARIRLYWFDGYVSQYPDPIDEDTQVVSLNIEAGRVVLHVTPGTFHYFDAAHDQDIDGFAIFRER